MYPPFSRASALVCPLEVLAEELGVNERRHLKARLTHMLEGQGDLFAGEDDTNGSGQRP